MISIMSYGIYSHWNGSRIRLHIGIRTGRKPIGCFERLSDHKSLANYVCQSGNEFGVCVKRLASIENQAMSFREELSFYVDIVQYFKMVCDETDGNNENACSSAFSSDFLQDLKDIRTQPFFTTMASALVCERPTFDSEQIGDGP